MKYHLKIDLDTEITDRVFSSVFRNNYEEDGFIIISFNENIDSKELRKQMVRLKKTLSLKCEEVFDQELDFYWLGRFNQQNTTKFHRDNAPKDSYLMLGYEPTKIESKLSFADNHKLISDKNIPIEKYYELHNPIFKDGEELLKPYIKEVVNFDSASYKIVLMNNSDLNSDKTFGVLHKAEIMERNLSHDRVINSMMLCLKSSTGANKVSEAEVNEFLNTDLIG